MKTCAAPLTRVVVVTREPVVRLGTVWVMYQSMLPITGIFTRSRADLATSPFMAAEASQEAS